MTRLHIFLTLVLSAPLLLIIGNGQEPEKKKELPVREMAKEIANNPLLGDKSFYYDPGFKAVGSFSVHDHFAKRMCLGYLLSDGESLSYRYIRAMPGLGSSNDAFQTSLSNIVKVEYKFYKASKGLMDQYPERLSTEFFFESPIKGLVADWTKKDIKFDIWDVSFGYTLMGYLKERNIPMVEKD